MIMDILMNQKCLASMAVFSQMHNAKKGVYDIIRSFIISFLTNNRKYKFPISEIVYEINEYYNFNIPSAVIQTALKGINGVTKNDNIYTVDYEIIPCYCDMKMEEALANNEKIFDDLVEYINGITSEKMTNTRRELLFKNFCSFLLNNNIITKDTEYISAYIISNDNNILLQNQLNEIKEGIIIYSGITTDADLSKLGYWSNTLYIYLDTEILFHIAGLNGDYYLQQACDFMSLVKEINRKKKYVYLKYFIEVEKEIENFFMPLNKL